MSQTLITLLDELGLTPAAKKRAIAAARKDAANALNKPNKKPTSKMEASLTPNKKATIKKKKK